MMKDPAKFNVRMPSELYVNLQKLAEEMGVSLNAVICFASRKFLAQELAIKLGYVKDGKPTRLVKPED